jgi:two-component system NtrC family sensor kinase
VQIGRTLMIYTDSTSPPEQVTPREVDIVGQADSDRDSRIVHAVSQAEGSHLFSDAPGQLSPWLARARSNLQVMYRTALAVSHTMDIDQLLQRIMELIFEWVEADRGCVMLVDRDTDELVPKVRRDRQRHESGEKLSISRTILDYVRTRQEGVLTSDARDDERWDPAASIVKMGVREAICVPMQGRYGIVGVIYIDTFTPPGQLLQQTGPSNKFSDEHLKLMVAIGHQAALAVEDTSYYSAMLQAERLAAMGQTIAGLSHHVKNILQGIRGGSFLIQEGLNGHDWEVTRKGWDIVEKNQERISNLVMDMLTFSKERQPDMVPSDLNRIVGEVLELMQARARELGVEIVDRRSADIPRMTFDPEALHRAILNVVTNALDACAAHDEDDQPATPSGTSNDAPRVEVATQYDAPHSRLVVTIRDNGVGISAEQIKRVFHVFVSNKGQRGTGLGLPVSQKILQEHGGEIRVESQPGQGSCFTLQWPAMSVEATGAMSLES